MGEENQPNQNENPISKGQTANFNISSGGANPEKKGKKKTGLLIFAIVLIMAIVAGLAYYFTIYTKPDEIYKRLIGSTIDSYTNEMNNMNYKTSKASFKLDADIETDKIDKKITDLINKINIGMNVQTDNENQQFVMDLKANYDKEDLVDIQMYSNVQEEKTYMKLKSFLDKYIEIEDMDEEFYTYFKEILEKQKMGSEQKQSLQKAMSILKKELTDVIKKEYCTAEKEDITIAGKKVATTKNTIKMNEKQVKEELTKVFKNLRENEDFINCFEDKDEMTESLKNLEELMDELDEDDKSIMEVTIYTSGFMQNVEKFTVTVYTEETDETITMAFTKTGKETYDFEILDKNKTVCKGNVKVEEKNKQEGNIQFTIEVEDFGKLNLNIEYSQKFNEDIDKIDVNNAVKSEELTESDQEKLMTNLQKSKLYELIEDFVGGKSSNLIENTMTNSDKDDEKDEAIEDEEDKNNTDKQEEKKEETKENEIISYDGKTKITFKLPAGYQSTYVSDNYKSIEKGNTTIKVSTSYADKDEYYKDLQEKKEYYEKEDSNYKNVTLSDKEKIEINGRTFYRAELSYEYAGGGYTTKYETTYMWSEISDESVVDFEIRGSSDVNPKDLEEIVTINVEKNK